MLVIFPRRLAASSYFWCSTTQMLVQNSFKFSVLALVRVIVMKTEFISNPKNSVCWVCKRKIWVDSKTQILKSVNNSVCIFPSIFNQSSKYAAIVNLSKRSFGRGSFRVFVNFCGPWQYPLGYHVNLNKWPLLFK